MNNSQVNRLSFVSAVIFNTALLAVVYFHGPAIIESFAQQQNNNNSDTISFTLQGNHSEDTVSETLEAVGYNTTIFEPLNNGSIIVNASAILNGDDDDEDNNNGE